MGDIFRTQDVVLLVVEVLVVVSPLHGSKEIMVALDAVVSFSIIDVGDVSLKFID
jgi:hypothetical protein